MKKVLAIIPARGGSKGILRKNLQKVAGKPLVVHAVEQAMAADNVDIVLVNTDDDEIAEVVSRPGVVVMERPPDMASDSAKVDPLLIWTVQEYEKKTGARVDIVVLLYPTAPLRKSATIDEAIRLVSVGDCDSALSLYEENLYLWGVDDGVARPTNYDPQKRAPRQTENWNQWVENKAVYVMKRDLLLDTGCRLGGRIGYVEMNKLESVDVDSLEDLVLINAIYKMMEDPNP
jgi:CMP-N,N'-diacetyllegionaminic acid synthase